MNAHNLTADNVLFAARLTPYRSLGKNGFRILMLAIGSICFVVGLVFAMAGVWPVFGFMGLDFLLIYWAFRLNYRDARSYEDVEVTNRNVLLRKVDPQGHAIEHDFPQFGTRFEIKRHEEIGITAMHLANRARRVQLGQFLNPADRKSFAGAFAGALSRAKR